MTTKSSTTAPPASPPGNVGEVFRVFLKLGLISFGGPIAHLGYFREELIVRRRWLADDEYADLVALSQFFPGPASSQVGFGIGLHRAGPAGAIAAFLAFTLPSAALLVALAYGAALFEGTIGAGVLTGLTIVAVAIVAQAVWGMARTLTPRSATRRNRRHCSPHRPPSGRFVRADSGHRGRRHRRADVLPNSHKPEHKPDRPPRQ